MRIGSIAAGVSLVLLAACQYHPAPVAIAGDPGTIRSLAGTWTGNYLGTDSRRSGSIVFTIRVEGDSAFGDVMMEQPLGVPVLLPADDPMQHRVHARSPQLLAVRFVAVIGGEVSGALEPYVAPDCDCAVRTTFTGRVRGDSIAGTYETRGSLIGVQTGTWGVLRKR